MHRKRNSFTVALLLSVAQLFSQKDSSLIAPLSGSKIRYELGTQIYGINARAGNFQSNYSTVWDNQVFSGLYLKKYFGKNAIRTSIEYSKRRIYRSADPELGRYYMQGQLASLDLKLGFQHLMADKKFSPYWFTDLEYSYFFATPWPIYNVMPYSSYLVPYNPYYRFYTMNGSQIALNPGIGIRCRLSSMVCLNIESAAQLFYFHENRAVSINSLNSIGINAKPIKISLGVTF